MQAKLASVFYSLLVLFLPTQLGKHFWPDFASIQGLQVDYLSPTLYVTDLLIVALIIVWISRKKNVWGEVVSFIKKKSTKIYLCIIGVLFVGIFLSDQIVPGFYFFGKLLEFSFVAWYTATHLQTAKQFLQIVLLLSIGATIESMLSLMQFLQQSSVNGLWYFLGERNFNGSTPGIANASLNGALVLRSYGTFPHPNVLAGYLLISMTFVLFSFSQQISRWIKVIFLLALSLGTAGLLTSMSRIPVVLWMVTVIAFLLWRFSFAKKMKVRKIFMGSVVSLLIIAGFLMTPSATRLFATSFTEESLLQREVLTKHSFAIIGKHPLFGVGLGQFLPSLAVEQETSVLLLYQPVHNIFLLIAAETGIIVLILFCFFLAKTFFQLKEKIAVADSSIWLINISLMVIFYQILMIGLFDHYFVTLQQGQLLFALVIGLCWARVKSN